jgi:hypothetical protein
MERVTVATAPVISVDQQQRLRLIRKEQRRSIEADQSAASALGQARGVAM